MSNRVLAAAIFASLTALLVFPFPTPSVQGQPQDAWGHPRTGTAVPDKRVRIGLIGIAADTRGPAFADKNVTHNQFVPAESPLAPVKLAPDAVSLKELHVGVGAHGSPEEVEFLVADVFGFNNHGHAQEDAEKLLAALDWMKQMRANMVIIGSGNTGDQLVKQAISDLTNGGTAIIVLAPPGTDRVAR
jgi:hypothetical protein